MLRRCNVKQGDAVIVRPVNPLAVGRGKGTVVHLGKTLVRVKFPQWDRAIACLLADCHKGEKCESQ